MSASKRQEKLQPTVAHLIAKFFHLLEYVDVRRVSLRLWGKTSKVLLGLGPNGQGKSMASQHGLCVGRMLGVLVPVMSGALSLAASWEGLRDSNPAVKFDEFYPSFPVLELFDDLYQKEKLCQVEFNFVKLPMAKGPTCRQKDLNVSNQRLCAST